MIPCWLREASVCSGERMTIEPYFEDTMRAGHYENRKESVDLMIRTSPGIIRHLLELGVGFDKNPDGSLKYTKEGAHSRPRICFHEDITGKAITTVLQERTAALPQMWISWNIPLWQIF